MSRRMFQSASADPTISLRRNAIAIALHACVLGAGIAALVAAPNAWAQPEQAQNKAYTVAAGSLEDALNSFARQAGITLSFDPAMVAGKQAAGLSGTYGIAEGLAMLLSANGLEAVARDDGGYSLRVAPSTDGATMMPAVKVTADGGILPNELPKPYAGRQVARGSRVGMLGNTDTLDTPFSTKSYTAELIRQQGVRSIDDVVANDPSIRTSLSSTFVLDQSSIRGFQVGSSSYLFDGVPGLFSYGRVAVQNYERVEILKGPAAGLVGALGAVGGSINLVPKRATDEPVRSGSLFARDESLLGLQADIGQRFGQDKAFGVRLNVYAESGDEYNGSNRKLLAPQLSLDYRGERLRFMLDGGYVRYEMDKLGRNWTLRPGVAVPEVPNPRTNPMPDWWTFEEDQVFGLATAEWDFSPNWTGYARVGRVDEDKTPGPTPSATPLDGDGQFTFDGAFFGGFKSINTTSDVGLRGTLELGPTTHQLAFSVLTIRRTGEFSDAEMFETAIPGSLYESPQFPDPYASGSTASTDLIIEKNVPNNQTDFAVADNVSLIEDRLRLTLAARSKRIEQGAYDQDRVSPTFAALYKLTSSFSVYGNYAEALTQGAIAPDTAENAGEQLAPYVSEQYEAGLKWDRGRYGLTAAYFDIRQVFAFTDADNVFRAGGQQQNRGVELETFGEPASGLRVLGGVAWIDAVQTKTATGVTEGNKALGVPEFTANLGVEHDVMAVSGLTLTGRFIHTGSAYVDLVNTQKLDSWNRVDIGARYFTRLTGQAVTLRAGISNLFDSEYWQTGGRNILVVAPPRIWQLSASVDL